MTTPGTDQAVRAAGFRAMHRGTVLVLPNAWDPGSAAVIEAAAAKAIATTSAGVSWAVGAPDAQGLDRQQMVGAVAQGKAARDFSTSTRTITINLMAG